MTSGGINTVKANQRKLYDVASDYSSKAYLAKP